MSCSVEKKTPTTSDIVSGLDSLLAALKSLVEMEDLEAIPPLPLNWKTADAAGMCYA